MIGWLRGRVLGRTMQGEILVDVNGVGYRVTVPASLMARGSDAGAEIELHVHTHVREDAIVLYGFAQSDERRCFEALLGAHGVGPALALAVVSSLGPDQLVRAVVEDDLATLCEVPGIGKKTAARLLLDLKSKLEVPDLGDVAVASLGNGAPSPRGEVRAALTELGYGSDEIRRALAGVGGEGPVEELLRDALRELASAR